MSLISAANAILLCDKLASAWKKTTTSIGLLEDQGSPVAGTVQEKLSQALDMIVADFDDLDQIDDLGFTTRTALNATNAEALFALTGWMKPALAAIQTHCKNYGTGVDATIKGLDTFLTYYNGGSGGAAYANMLTPEFARMWSQVMVTPVLPAAGLMSPAIHPLIVTTGSDEGMGSIEVDGTFEAGDDVDVDTYSMVNVILEVVTSFAGGASNPSVAIQGLDTNGDLTTYATVSLGEYNPPALTTTTTAEAIVGGTRQEVTVNSLDGIVAGSVLRVNFAGIHDYETIQVEAVDTDDVTLTAVFQNSYESGVSLTGNRAYAVSIGYRIRAISDLDLTVGTHTAGKVRVCGIQDRVCV